MPEGAQRLVGSEPVSSELRLGPAAPVFLPLAACALLVAWALGGVALVFGGLMLATLTTALIFGWRNPSGILVRARRAELRVVGEEFLLSLELRRRSPVGAARDLLLSCGASGSGEARPAGLVTALVGAAPLRVPLALKLTERGRVRELPLRIESSYPFGLLRRVSHYQLPVDLLALPRLGSLGDLGRLSEGATEQARTRRLAQTEEDEFRSLKEWREGMSLRRVHWKVSARRGRPLLMELEDRNESPVHVVLVTAEAGAAASPARSFEVAVSLAATLCEHYLRRGRGVRLSFAGAHIHGAPPLRGRGGWFACLEALAEVQRESKVESVDLAPLVSQSVGAGESVVAVFAGGRRPAELLRCPAPALQLDVDDAGLDGVFHRGRAFGAPAPLGLSDAS